MVGAGQTPGEKIGNGRAVALLFAREGAHVLCVDRIAERASETAVMIEGAGGTACWLAADVTKAVDCTQIVDKAKRRYGRIDLLVNNVGIGGGGDAPVQRLEEVVFDRVLAVISKGCG